MTDAIVELIEGALNSPWGLLALAAVAAVDGFFPVVPSEPLVGRRAGDRLTGRLRAGT